MAFVKRILRINLLLRIGVCSKKARRNSCISTGSGQLPNFGIGELFQTATLNAMMKADVPLVNSGASNCFVLHHPMDAETHNFPPGK